MAEVKVTAKMVKELRDLTGAGPLDSKKALEANGGDVQKAVAFLREKGLKSADKKLAKGRTMSEGVIEMYQHHNGLLGVMVEVNCETDFVARNENFQQFAKDVALHIVSARPKYVKREDIPADVLEAEKAIQLAQPDLEGKPDNIKEKIVEGRLSKWYQEVVLMEQPFVKDEDKTIEDYLKETVATIGESVEISRFARYEVGEALGDNAEGSDDE